MSDATQEFSSFAALVMGAALGFWPRVRLRTWALCLSLSVAMFTLALSFVIFADADWTLAAAMPAWTAFGAFAARWPESPRRSRTAPSGPIGSASRAFARRER